MDYDKSAGIVFWDHLSKALDRVLQEACLLSSICSAPTSMGESSAYACFNSCDVTFGVPQGSVLRSLLFSVCVNTLPSALSDIFKAWADKKRQAQRRRL